MSCGSGISPQPPTETIPHSQGSISETRAENDRLQAEVTQLQNQLNREQARREALERSLAAAQSAAAEHAPLLGSKGPEVSPELAELAAAAGIRDLTSLRREMQQGPATPDPTPDPSSSSSSASSAFSPGEADTPSSASAPASLGQASESSLPMGASMRLDPLRPTAQEREFLSNFMRFIVRHFPVIDKQAFLAAFARQQDESLGSTTVSVDADSVKKRL